MNNMQNASEKMRKNCYIERWWSVLGTVTYHPLTPWKSLPRPLDIPAIIVVLAGNSLCFPIGLPRAYFDIYNKQILIYCVCLQLFMIVLGLVNKEKRIS
jgi:hypothetical protein